MAASPLGATLDRVRSQPAVERASTIWNGSRFSALLRAAVGLFVLYAVLRIVLRHNEPPQGIFLYGAILGLLYALLAIGLILIYRATRIINFAQAEMGAVGAVLAVLLIKVHHWPYLAALAVAVAAGVLSGVLVEFLIVRRFVKASRLVLSVATIGVGLVLAGFQLVMPRWVGAVKFVDPAPPKTPLSAIHLTLGNYHFNANSLIIPVWVAGIVIALGIFFRFTDVGLAVRGSAENADRAALLGVPVKRVSTVVWAIAGVLSAISMFLRIPIIGLPVGVLIGPEVLLYGLAAAVIAKMESFGTAVVAGVALGVMEQTVYYFSKDPTVAQALILPVLLVTMLLQRDVRSRGQDTGQSTWSLAKEFRPIPPEMRRVPEVVWGRTLLSVGALALLVFGYGGLGPKQQILASVVVIYGIVAVSLVILTGWAGQISLGQWGLAGIGAAAAGNLVARHNNDFFLTLVVAGLIGAAAAVVIGLPALRISGLYLAVTTLAFAILTQTYLLSPRYFRSLLPAQNQHVLRPFLYGRYSLNGDRAFYYCCLVVLALCLMSARALRRSRTGRVIVALRDNQKGAQAYAVAAAKAKLWAFAISGFWAAVAGALFAYQLGAVSTQAFPPDLSLTLLIIVVIGGVTSLPGAMLGTLFIGILKYSDLSPAFTLLASGFGALVLLVFLPGGLAQAYYGTRDSILRYIAKRRNMVVPSLIADVRQEAAQNESDVLLDAMASVEGSQRGTMSLTRGRAASSASSAGPLVRCPVCGEEMPPAQAAEHDHLQAVHA